LCRSREELTFQTHALQNHPQSQTLFHGICPNSHQNVKKETLKIEPDLDAIKEDLEINDDDKSEKEPSLNQESELYDDLIPMIEEDNFEDEKKIEKHHDSSDVTTEFKAARSIFYLKFF
jgi:hypothetical protein